MRCISTLKMRVACLQTLMNKRNEALQKMLDVAASRAQKSNPPSTSPHMRVDLRESQILDNPTAYTNNEPDQMGTVILEDSEGELRAQQSNLNAIMKQGDIKVR